MSYPVGDYCFVYHYTFVHRTFLFIHIIFIIMHYKNEIRKLIDNCKEIGFLCVPDSLIFHILYLARFEPGRPLVKYVYELVELGFNLFKHDNNPEILIMMKNIIAVCDKELETLKIKEDENKKNR